MRRPRICTATFILASLASRAFAEGIPEQVIQIQHKNCIESCVKSSGGQTAVCEKACSCADVETQKNFSVAEYTELGRQIAANPSAPTFTPEIKTKYDAVFAACSP